MISLLVSHFPEGVNQTSDDGNTRHSPLIYLVYEGHTRPEGLESAKILLTQGHADVRAGCPDDLSKSWGEPLRRAARYGDIDMCRVLVEFGHADPRRVLKIEDGQPPTLIDPVDRPELAPKVLETMCELAGIDS